LADSHKLDPWSLDEGLRPKSGKPSLNLHDNILEGKSIGYETKGKKKRTKKAESIAHDLENQGAS
jgi:hypothetical protein